MEKRNKTAEVVKNSSETAQENKYEGFINNLVESGMDEGNAKYIAYLMEQKDLANDYESSLEDKHPANQGEVRRGTCKVYSGYYMRVLCSQLAQLPKTKRDTVNIIIGAIISLCDTQVRACGENPDVVAKVLEADVNDMFNNNNK